MYVLDMRAQNLSYAPGLSYASTGMIGRVAVEDLRDVTESGIGQMFFHGQEPLGSLPAGGVGSAIHLHVRSNERSEQPGPYRPLVIRAIAFCRDRR